MKELLKERRSTEVEECRSTVVAEGGVTQKAAAGSRSSETEGDLFVSEVGVRQKDTEEGQEPFGQVKAPPQLAETQEYVAAPPLTSCMEQKMEAEDEKAMEELSSCTCVINNCTEKGLKFFQLLLMRQKREVQPIRLTCARRVTMTGD